MIVFNLEVDLNRHSGIQPVSVHVLINILNSNYINSLTLCSSLTQIANDMH